MVNCSVRQLVYSHVGARSSACRPETIVLPKLEINSLQKNKIKNLHDLQTRVNTNTIINRLAIRCNNTINFAYLSRGRIRPNGCREFPDMRLWPSALRFINHDYLYS